MKTTVDRPLEVEKLRSRLDKLTAILNGAAKITCEILPSPSSEAEKCTEPSGVLPEVLCAVDRCIDLASFVNDQVTHIFEQL